MSGRRVARLNEQIRRELSEIVRLRLRDPRVTGVTISAVEVSGDLSHARIFVRTLGGVSTSEEAVEGLDHAAAFIRRELGQRLTLRRTPELHFQPDRSQEGAVRIERILDEVRPDGGWDEDGVEEDGEDAAASTDPHDDSPGRGSHEATEGGDS